MGLERFIYIVMVTFERKDISPRRRIAGAFETENTAVGFMFDLSAKIGACKTNNDFEMVTQIWIRDIESRCTKDMFLIHIEKHAIQDASPEEK